MPRVKTEFMCTQCQKYFDIMMNISLNGNYRIHCPCCGHVHYRMVREGLITDERFPVNDSVILYEDIVPMKSSCRDKSKETELDSPVSPRPEGFLHRLWKEFSDA